MEQDRKDGVKPEDPAAPAAAARQKIQQIFTALEIEQLKSRKLKEENEKLQSEISLVQLDRDKLQEELDKEKATKEVLMQTLERLNADLHDRSLDPVTRLPSQDLFKQKLRQFLARSDRRLISCAFGCVDLAFFKKVNDQHGHEVGDDVLRQVAAILSSVRESHKPSQKEKRYLPRKSEYDLACRAGGDEFLFFISSIASKQDCWKLGHRIARSTAKIAIKGQSPVVMADIGIVHLLFELHEVRNMSGPMIFQMKRWADYCMYRAKNYAKSQNVGKIADHCVVRTLRLETLFTEPPPVDQTGR